MRKLSKKQKELKKKHGTPKEFSVACYKAVPDFISIEEADTGIEKYNNEWIKAGAKRCLRLRRSLS